MNMTMSKVWETVKDREPGVLRVGCDRATEQQLENLNLHM